MAFINILIFLCIQVSSKETQKADKPVFSLQGKRFLSSKCHLRAGHQSGLRNGPQIEKTDPPPFDPSKTVEVNKNLTAGTTSETATSRSEPRSASLISSHLSAAPPAPSGPPPPPRSHVPSPSSEMPPKAPSPPPPPPPYDPPHTSLLPNPSLALQRQEAE